jgi:DNA (cytosine-5)-methyltransferase 1
MRELSLFTGAGGGLLGTHLLGWTPIGYVEFNDYCQRVIAQRIKDSCIPNAPIFGDIKTFISEGYARSYTGLVDCLTGGFPCQPFSVAGKRKGADDERNMWPATIECVRIIRPRYCFFENVPGLLNSGYFGRIVADLAQSGYLVRWRCLSAAEVGAPHKRDRLWIVADANGGRCEEHVTRQEQPVPQPSEGGWWSVEPRLGRLAGGVPNRVGRLKAAGNGQVPAVAAAAWHLLTEESYA